MDYHFLATPWVYKTFGALAAVLIIIGLLKAIPLVKAWIQGQPAPQASLMGYAALMVGFLFLVAAAVGRSIHNWK